MVLLKYFLLLTLLTSCFSSPEAAKKKPSTQLPSEDTDPAALVLTPSTQTNMDISGGSSPGSSVILSLTNTGEEDSLTVQTPSISGSTANFQITVNNCTGSILSAGQSCTISIRPMAVGNKSYSLDFSISDSRVSSNTISLSGTASGFSLTIQGTENKIHSATAAAGDLFGSSVAIDATSIVVGAYGDNGAEGSVSLFRLDPSDNLWKETKITASDKDGSADAFGYSVDLSGDTIVVGAAYDDASSSDSGSAYIYRLDPSDNTWNEHKLTASDASSSDAFGSSVAVNNTMVAIGAQLADDRGALYVFRLDPSSNLWHQTKIVASDANVADFFASSIALDNNHIIVGAPQDDDTGSASGSAYIFRFDPSDNTWNQSKLTASDAAANDQFGSSVSFHGSIAVVGSPYDDAGASNNGSAYIFRLDPSDNLWKETKLTASDFAVDDNFGSSVNVYNNTVAIGAKREDSIGTDTGSAYIYQLDPSDNLWKETKINPSDGASNDYFGPLDISGNILIVGSPENDSLGANAGAIYTYYIKPNTTSTTLAASDTASDFQFGDSIDMIGNTIVVGANMANSLAGAAYVYRLDPSDNLWKETIITASDAAVGDFYGYHVAISNEILAISAIADDTAATNSGSIYVYRFDPSDNTWKQTKLTASDPGADDVLGISLAVDNFSIIAGSQNDDNGTDSGAAYLFRFDPSSNTWIQNKFLASDAASFDYFGSAVGIENNTVAVGAMGDQFNRGAVYLYRLDPSDNLWKETKISPSDTSGNNDFGASLDISGNNLLVGAPRTDAGVSFQGSAYLYRYDPSSNTWTESIITASDPAMNDAFGTSVSIHGNNIIIGSPSNDDGGSNTGSVYLYKFDPSSSSWIESKINHSSPSVDDNFGKAVRINANHYIIGCPNDDNIASDSGTVFFDSFDIP